MKKISFRLISLLCYGAVTVWGQAVDNRKLMVDDFNAFMDLLENNHPDPYTAFGGRQELMRRAQETRSMIGGETTARLLSEMINHLLVPLADGHTRVYSSGESNEAPNKYSPLVFKESSDGLFVVRVTDEYSFFIGSRLLAVNGRSLEELLDEAGRRHAAENHYGTLSEVANCIVNKRGGEPFFGRSDTLVYSLRSPDGSKATFTAVFKEKQGWIGEEQLSAAGLTYKNPILYGQMIGGEVPVGYFAWHRFYGRELIDAAGGIETKAGLAQLKQLYDYALYWPMPDDPAEALADIPAVYDEFAALLDSMKKSDSKYLIVDLRKNGGGMTPLSMPVLYMLYGDKYLSFTSDAQYNRIISPLLMQKWGYGNIQNFNEHNSTDFRYGDFLFGAFHLDSGESLEAKRTNPQLISYNGIGMEYTAELNGQPLWEPHVIVLCSPRTFSAAHHFMYYLREIGKATIVGVPSSQAGNTFMEVTQFSLPNTGIRGSISNAVQVMFPDDPQMGKVFMPDYSMTYDDYKRYGFDPDAEILFALDLIRSGELDAK